MIDTPYEPEASTCSVEASEATLYVTGTIGVPGREVARASQVKVTVYDDQHLRIRRPRAVVELVNLSWPEEPIQAVRERLAEQIATTEQLARDLDGRTRELTAARDELKRRNIERTELANQLIETRGRASAVASDRNALRRERDHLRGLLEQSTTRLTESDREVIALKDERDELRSRLDTAVGYDTEQADRVAADIRRAGAEGKTAPWSDAARNNVDQIVKGVYMSAYQAVKAVRASLGLPPEGGKDVARDTTNSETVVTNPATSNRLTMPTDLDAIENPPEGWTPRPLDMDAINQAFDAMSPAERAAELAAIDDAERKERLAYLRSDIEELVLDYCGFVDGAEVSAHGSADNDLAHERRGAAMAFLDHVRGASVLTGAFRITESEFGGWHVMPLAGREPDGLGLGDQRRWRVGRHYGVHLYAELPGGGSEPIGTMFRDELAQQVVLDHNRRL